MGFLSTLSLRRATMRQRFTELWKLNFYPRSPCGERPGKVREVEPGFAFLSTLSLRRATPATSRNNKNNMISIHALLAESDQAADISARRGASISIHALLAESDNFAISVMICILLFLSTLSLRRATVSLAGLIGINTHFYPRSPCGERPCYCGGNPAALGISIHALLAESDLTPQVVGVILINFYPRSPCGERRGDRKTYVRNSLFLSTLSLRRATSIPVIFLCNDTISIHALLAESDRQATQAESIPIGFLSTLSLRRATPCHGRIYQGRDYFYPRSPCGERHPEAGTCSPHAHISIHALLAESDDTGVHHIGHHHDFYPRSPCGERPTTSPA